MWMYCCGSTPPASSSAIPSATAATTPATTGLLQSLSLVPCPTVPTMPASASGLLPSNGASTISPPRPRTSPSSQTVVSGPTVLICSTTVPAAMSARKPSGPSATSCRAASFETTVITTSASSTASRGVAATRAPAASRSMVRSRLRF